MSSQGRGRPAIPESDLRDELTRLAEELGRTPTSEEMDDLGKYSHPTYRKQFGSWNEAVMAVGLPPNEGIPREAIIEDLQRIADEHGPLLTSGTLDKHGLWSAKTYANHLGSMGAVREAVREPLEGFK